MNNKVIMSGVLLLVTNISYAEMSGSITLASDNVSRGISDTDGGAATQAAIDYSQDNGMYAGVWFTNVDFNENEGVVPADEVDEAKIEIDYTVGMSGDFSRKSSWDVGTSYITYPGAEKNLNYDFWEAYGVVSYETRNVILSPEFVAELYYTPDGSENSGAASYYVGGVMISLPVDIAMTASVGRQTFNDTPEDDYSDWKAGFSKEIDGMEFELSYTDTSLSKAECGGDNCEARVVFTVTSTIH